MPPENAADYLINLKNTGKIAITLDTVDNLIVCQIKNSDRNCRNPEQRYSKGI